MHVLWSGPPAPWADSLGSVSEVADVRGEDADLVVLAGGTGGFEDWLRRPRTRPAVVAVARTDDEEDDALRAGAEGVVAPDATPAEAARVARRAASRHVGVQADAELFRVVVESATDLLTVTDADGRTLYANPAADVQLGRSPADVVASDPLSSVHPDDRPDVLRSLADAFATGAAAVLQYRVVDPDGGVRIVESRGRAVPGPNGAYVGVVATRDVTDRTEMQRRLSESRARYRTVVDALPDVVARLSPDGLVLDFHVPEVFATEFPAMALLGRRLQDVIPADLADRFLDAARELGVTGEAVAYNYQVEIGGRTHHREVRMAPVEGGEVLSILRDVTRLRENETALERSRAELRALATHLQNVREDERSRLSREVHDVLGQQLTAIRLGIGWFGRHFAADDAVQARLAGVRETIDDTIHHVRQIAADLRPGVLDDFGLASAAAWQAERFEERTGTPCALDLQGRTEPPPEVATAAFRVLQEALTNVARHADAESVTVTLVLGPASVRLVVADDGRGFDPEAADQRSLGLVGMRERAGAQDGTLDVRAVPDQGTVVECTLPHSPPDRP